MKESSMTVVTLDDIPPPPRDSTRPRPQHPRIDPVRIAYAAKTLLGQALRMLLVVSCFAAVVATVVAVRLYAFVPALHQ
jgi:hypothetical protein